MILCCKASVFSKLAFDEWKIELSSPKHESPSARMREGYTVVVCVCVCVCQSTALIC